MIFQKLEVNNEIKRRVLCIIEVNCFNFYLVSMDTQNLPNNSAKRLLEILLKINSAQTFISSNGNFLTGSPRFIDVFCKALNIEADLEISSYHLIKLFMLIESIENDIQKLDILKTNLYIKTIQSIRKWLSIQNYNISWDELNENLKNPESLGFQMLYNCAIDLGEQEVIINQEQLNELKDNIQSLLEKIIESDISQPLKTLLREKLIELRKVVEDYQFYGADGIRKIAEETLGALMINQTEITQEKDKKPVQDFVKLLKDILDIAIKTKQFLPEGIGETLKNLLPPG